MIKQNSIAAAVLLSLFAVPASAATVLTDANLDQFEAMIPKIQHLEQRPQNKQFNLQHHCDWPRHYREISTQEKDSAYQAQIEKLAKEYGFTPVQLIELSAKVTWPVLDSVQPMLEVSRQALMFLPAAQRQKTEKSIQQGQQYYKTLTGCLTADDKNALVKHHDRIMQMAKRLGGVDLILPSGMATPNKF